VMETETGVVATQNGQRGAMTETTALVTATADTDVILRCTQQSRTRLEHDCVLLACC
jgi:hypothetical protein